MGEETIVHHKKHRRWNPEESGRMTISQPNFLRAMDRIDPYVKVNASNRYYIDLRDPEHVGISYVEFEAMKRLVERTNELLDQGLLELDNTTLNLAKGRQLDDTFLLKSKAWFGGI